MSLLNNDSDEAKLVRALLTYGPKGFKSPIDSIEMRSLPEENRILGKFSSGGRVFYYEITRGEGDTWGKSWSQTEIM